ncbi:MAG: hypothetical protein HY289_05725 [Planctomycetes bacterium]|nr:hypothetical protein [Planctomycetota bacterium]
MPVKVRNKKLDAVLKQIVKTLERYAAGHPNAEVEAYRHDNVSVRIRVIDPDFKGMSRGEREVDLWAMLHELPEEVVADISLLILLSPAEVKKSFASMEFDDPIPARI